MNGQQFTIIQPPISIPIMSSQGTLSPEWRQFFAGIQYYLQKIQSAFQITSLTTDQQSELSNVANGSIMYNNTLNAFQGYVDGSWKTFTLS